MTDQHTWHKRVIAAAYLIFSLMTIFIIASSNSSQSGEIFGSGVIRVAFLQAPTIPALILVFGFLHAVFKRSMKTFMAWFLIFLGCMPALFLFYNYAIECDVSSEIKRQIYSTLTAGEIASVNSPDFICPTFFSYRRESDGEWAVVTGAADFIHGTKVWFGTQ
jgi:hypothetical protein